MPSNLCKVPKPTHDLQFIKFIPLSKTPSDEEVQSFIERINIISFDINELLQLQDEQFWNQAVHNKTLHRFLDAFLQSGSSFLTSTVDESIKTNYSDLLDLVLKVFIRLCNFEYKTVSNPVEVLYDNFVIDLPKLLDICRIYYGLSRKAVVGIVENLFMKEKRYYNDLDETMKVLSNVLKSVEDITACSADKHVFLTEYVFDISHTLLAFLSVLSELSSRRPSEVCFSAGLLDKMAEFFEHCLVPLQHEIESNLHLSLRDREKLLFRLSEAGAALTRALREGLIEPCLLRPLLLLDDGSADCLPSGCSSSTAPPSFGGCGNQTAKDFVDTMLRLLNHRQACLCLLVLYPLDDDLSLLQQVGTSSADLDEATVQYLTEASQSLLAEANVTASTAVVGRSSCRSNRATVSAASSVSRPVASSSSAVAMQPSCSMSLPVDVQAIKEVLPHFDVDAIRRCLDAYDGDSSRVINAALEGTISEAILNPSLASSQPKPDKPAFRDETGLSAAKHSSDLATAAATGLVRLSANTLWQGKRSDSFACRELKQLPALGDREKRVTTRLAVSIWEDVEDKDRGNAVDEFANPNRSAATATATATAAAFTGDAYDDEYDDTYDIVVGTVEKDASDESAVVKATAHGHQAQTQDQPIQGSSFSSRHGNPCFTSRGAYWPSRGADCKASSGASYASSSQDLAAPPPSRSSVLPIENPEIVRQRQNQYRQAYRRGRLGQPTLQSQAMRGKPVPPQSQPTGGEGRLASHDQGLRAEGGTRGFGAPARNYWRGRFNSHNRRRLADKKRQLSAYD